VAQGVFGYRIIDTWRRGAHHQTLLGVVLETPLQIPKRFSVAD
jgi:hypothetical protein